MSDREEQVNPAEGTASSRPEPMWSLEPNPVESFTSTIEHALRQLSIELAGIRAERDGLRLELEGLRAQHELLRQQLQNRARFEATVRELGEITRTLNVPVAWVEREPAPPVPPTPPAPPSPPPPPLVPQQAVEATDAFAWADPTPTAADVDWSGYLGQPGTAAAPAPPVEERAPDAVTAAAPPTEVPSAVWVPTAPPEDPTPVPADDAADAGGPPTAPAEPVAPRPEPEPLGSFRSSTAGETADPFGLQTLGDDVWQVPSRERGGRRGTRSSGLLVRIARRVGMGLIGVVILAMVLVAIGPKVLPYQTFFVRSGSMEPTIEVGELIVLTRVDASDLGEGDIITFERPDRPGTMVTHRIVAVETTDAGKVFQTKGDANGTPDVWRVPASGEGWKYSFGIPKIGYVFGYLNTPQARLALLAIPAAILGLLSLIDIWKPKGKPRSEQPARARR